MAAIEAISTTYLEADAASVTFSSIPSTFEHLQLRCSIRTTGTARNSANLQFNGDTGSNYASHRMHATGSSASAARWSGLTYMLGVVGTGGNSSSSDYSGVVIDILDYANTNKNTTVQFMSYAAGAPDSFFQSGLWVATAAVSSILMNPSNNLMRGSEFTLYGLNSS